MSPTPAKSRLRKLVITLAITAVFAAAFHIGERRKPGESFVIGLVRSAAPGHFTDPSPNYSKIEDGLWMGGYVDQPPPGTQSVLNLCGSKDPYAVERNKVEAIADGPPAPSVEWLGRQVSFIETERAAGRTVYVHCAAGASRSGMVMAAYFMRREGWSADQAISFLQSKRIVVNPNPAFRPLLAEWGKSVNSATPVGGKTR